MLKKQLNKKSYMYNNYLYLSARKDAAKDKVSPRWCAHFWSELRSQYAYESNKEFIRMRYQLVLIISMSNAKNTSCHGRPCFYMYMYGFSARHSRREYGYYEQFRGSRSGPERHYEWIWLSLITDGYSRCLLLIFPLWQLVIRLRRK